MSHRDNQFLESPLTTDLSARVCHIKFTSWILGNMVVSFRCVAFQEIRFIKKKKKKKQ